MQDGLSAEEVAALRASRERLVLAADADRRRLERELHDGLQQQLVALAVGMQLALASLESEPAAARAAMDELRAEVDQAIAQAARLAGRLSAPPPGIGGLAVALRAAAASAGVPASVE